MPTDNILKWPKTRKVNCMDENKDTIKELPKQRKSSAWPIALTVSVIVLSCVALPIGCAISEDYFVSQDIKNGANPLDAMCAHNTITSSVECQVRASLSGHPVK